MASATTPATRPAAARPRPSGPPAAGVTSPTAPHPTATSPSSTPGRRAGRTGSPAPRSPAPRWRPALAGPAWRLLGEAAARVGRHGATVCPLRAAARCRCRVSPGRSERRSCCSRCRRGRVRCRRAGHDANGSPRRRRFTSATTSLVHGGKMSTPNDPGRPEDRPSDQPGIRPLLRPRSTRRASRRRAAVPAGVRPVPVPAGTRTTASSSSRRRPVRRTPAWPAARRPAADAGGQPPYGSAPAYGSAPSYGDPYGQPATRRTRRTRCCGPSSSCSPGLCWAS